MPSACPSTYACLWVCIHHAPHQTRPHHTTPHHTRPHRRVQHAPRSTVVGDRGLFETVRLEKFDYFWQLERPLQTEDGIFDATVVVALPVPRSLNVDRDMCQPGATPLLTKKSTLKLGVEGESQARPEQQRIWKHACCRLSPQKFHPR